MSRRRLGQRWERRACTFLRSRGLRILQTGYQCRFGEIDIIGMDGQTLTIIEVRARGGGSVACALETVDTHKRRKLVRTARHLLMRRPEWSDRPLRFDVIAIDNIDTPQAHYEWIRNAFDAESAL
ncbi:MAG: YraN family protein [Gammaproteobacteria bacterium]|nr:YraN family protein [Gammaproteobacteria bacterium]